MLKAKFTTVINGVRVMQYLIPDGTVWRDGDKARKAGFTAGSLYKAQKLLSGGTGRVQGVTIHNTPDLTSAADDAEQYVRATINENMGAARVHFYADDNGAWQNLRAGTGIGDDPVGSAEVGWHAGDGATGTGNNTTIAIECIMGGYDDDETAEDNTAKLAAWLLWKNGLTVNRLYTHNHWLGYPDEIVPGARKNCPLYILPHWNKFRSKVQAYINKLKTEEKKMAKDNVPAEWAKEAVVWATENGIIKGDENGDLHLGDPVTRQELCVMLKRMADKEA